MRYNKQNTSNAEVREYLMSIIGSAPYGLIAVDLEGIVTIANGLAADYLAVKEGPAHLTDEPLLPCIAHLPVFAAAIEECLETGRKPFNLERIPNGKGYLTIRARLILDGLLLTLEDVTRQVLAEQELKVQARQLAASNKELEEFAWLSSHDMKSPIISLDGLMGMMEKNKAVKPEQAHVFRMALDSTRQMRKTIIALNDIIAFRKTLRLEKQDCRFDQVWKDVVSMLQETISATGARIDVDFTACPTVEYPAVHLRSILQNLLTNAIKYRQNGKPPIIHVRTCLEAGATVLEFEDEGLGIDLKRYRNKLFGLFQRFHTHTEGMGVGLHMIHSIVRSYDGHIRLKSKPGHGTIFKIFLNDDKVEQSPVGGR